MVTLRSVWRFPCLAFVILILSAFGEAVAQQVPEMPTEWRTRKLRIPSGYEMLQPSDIVIGFGWKRVPIGGGGIREVPGEISISSARVVPANDLAHANVVRNESWPGSSVPDKWHFLGSQTIGKVVIGWTAYVQVSGYWPASGAPPQEGAGFVYGAASFPEALEEASKRAISAFRSVGGARFETVHFEAGVACKPDYNLYRSNGTFNNLGSLPFLVLGSFPNQAVDVQRYGYQPQFPQEARELTQFLLAPAQKARTFPWQGSPRWWGVNDMTFNLPKAGMARPVFLGGLGVPEYRRFASLSESERQRIEETAKLASELYERSFKTPAALDPAVKLLMDAAQNGHVESQRLLGEYYRNRTYTFESQQQGLGWLAAAADQGSIGAKRSLVDNLLTAPDNPDPDRALATMEELAAGGRLEYFRKLAFTYSQGLLGLERNPTKAVEYLQRGIAFQGTTESEGYRDWLKDDLGAAYFRGAGVAQDRARAAQLLMNPVMEGGTQSTSGDFYRIYFYATGEHGFPRDLKRAAELLQYSHAEDWPDQKDQLDAAKAALAVALAAEPKK